MRMFSACVYVELAVHLSTELVLRKHSADSMFYDPYRFFTKSVASLLVSVAADISGVVEVNFLQFFFAGENDFICVDDDDVVTSVNMRCVGRFILAGQNFGNAGTRRPTVSPAASTIYHLRVMLPALAMNVVFISNDSF